MYLIRDLYLEYRKNTYNSTIKGQITQYKNEKRVGIDISPKIYKWPTNT